MTNNDELAIKLKSAAETARLSERRSGMEMAADSYEFIAITTPYNILSLLAERDADKKRTEMLEKYVDERDAQNQELLLNIGSLQQRIAELVESHKQLREAMAIIHNTIRMDGAYTPLAAIMSRAKRAYEESAAAAGINLEVGE